VNSGTCTLLDIERLKFQLSALERRTFGIAMRSNSVGSAPYHYRPDFSWASRW